MSYEKLSEKSLGGMVLSREECRSVLSCSQDRIPELLHAVFQVRQKYFGRRVIIQLLINAKSGLCSEDCAYCSQSAASHAEIEKYPLLDEEILIKGAFTAKASHAQRYCIVTSGYAPTQRDLDRLCRVVRKIKEQVDIEICNSLGHLSEEDARKLKDAGVNRYNHNLNTAERFYSQICSTHSYADRMETLRNAKAAGLQLCCGALFGMGEADDDIIDIALALRDVAASSIPVNFLTPIEGTALEKANYLNPIKCLSILCLMRFLNPGTEIRIAGGREFHLRSLQPLGLYPANSIFVSGYLTTGGQTPDEARQMIADMGFDIEPETVQKIKAV